MACARQGASSRHMDWHVRVSVEGLWSHNPLLWAKGGKWCTEGLECVAKRVGKRFSEVELEQDVGHRLQIDACMVGV